jgi:hypothetical protein
MHGISEFQTRLVPGKLGPGEPNKRMAPGDCAMIIVLLNSLLWGVFLAALGMI